MSNNVQSIERVLTIFEGIQITRLSELVRLNKSTTHRLLSTLLNIRYVVNDLQTYRYKLGLQIVYLSRNVLSNMCIAEVSKPYLEKLVSEVNETVHLCIEDNEEVLRRKENYALKYEKLEYRYESIFKLFFVNYVIKYSFGLKEVICLKTVLK